MKNNEMMKIYLTARCVFFSSQVSVSDGWRPEEESSFWKISAERSRMEGEQADFQSLTPSQIKSMEKGEKPLPSYLRQVNLDVTRLPVKTLFFRFLFNKMSLAKFLL